MLNSVNFRIYDIKKSKKLGIYVKAHNILKKEQIIKFLNRNCISGKKYKAYGIYLQALQIIHLFLYFYGSHVPCRDFFKIGKLMIDNFHDFFLSNDPYIAKRKRIVKRMPNRVVSYYIEKHRRSAEIFKWFFILSYKQPFKKVYQRYAFLFLNFIFFKNNNLFKELIYDIGVQKLDEFHGVEGKGKRRVIKKNRLNYHYYGKIINM